MPELMHPLAAAFRLQGDDPDAFLMLHGWTGSPAHFRLAAQYVNDHGHAAEVPLLAGHGTSVDHMVDTGWKDWVRSALDGYGRLAQDHPRVHVVGLSMGAIIGVLIAATGGVASITTVNAPQRLRNRRAWLAPLLYRDSTTIRPGDPAEIPPDPAARYWVHYEGSPLGTVPDLLALVRAARLALPRVEAPAVVIQSNADETVHPASAEIIYSRLGSRDKRIVWLRTSRHVALLDAERDLIHRELLRQAATAAGAQNS